MKNKGGTIGCICSAMPTWELHDLVILSDISFGSSGTGPKIIFSVTMLFKWRLANPVLRNSYRETKLK